VKKELILSQHHQKEDKEYPSDRVKAILNMSRALWGEVSPALRSARVKWDDSAVYLYFFYDGKISEEDNESAECVATEFIASYPDHNLEVNIIRLDYPQKVPEEGELVYKRREAKPQNEV
jgi:hypothetical protein